MERRRFSGNTLRLSSTNVAASTKRAPRNNDTQKRDKLTRKKIMNRQITSLQNTLMTTLVILAIRSTRAFALARTPESRAMDYTLRMALMPPRKKPLTIALTNPKRRWAKRPRPPPKKTLALVRATTVGAPCRENLPKSPARRTWEANTIVRCLRRVLDRTGLARKLLTYRVYALRRVVTATERRALSFPLREIRRWTLYKT